VKNEDFETKILVWLSKGLLQACDKQGVWRDLTYPDPTACYGAFVLFGQWLKAMPVEMFRCKD